MQRKPLSLDDAIRDMRGVALTGKLVPFVGAGLSRPLCRGWTQFLDALNGELGFKGGTVAGRSPDQLYRIADRAASALRLRSVADRSSIIRRALTASDQAAQPPPQAVALARGHWPLVISTNYDDVFRAARAPDRAPMEVRGRGPQDCEFVVRSMDSIHLPILWCIQGFVGGPLPPRPDHGPPPPASPAALLDQIVIGHHQYQLAANQSPAFRRAFAEVYRRRSLVFVGSGLAESYFVNLISEVVLNFGPNLHSHFALFSAAEMKRSQIDPDFLQMRLGVTAVVYGQTHAALPPALDRLCAPLWKEPSGPASTLQARVPRPLALSFEAPRPSVGEKGATEVSLRFAPLGKPAPGECAVLSVGLRRNGGGPLAPLNGEMVRSFLREHYGLDCDAGALPPQAAWSPVAPRLYRLKVAGEDRPVFAAAARRPDDRHPDRRDLPAITETTEDALAWIEALGEFRALRMGVLGAGDMDFANPIFCFIAQFSGVRRFLARPCPSAQPLQLIEIGIIDPRIITPVVEGRMPARELLASDLVRVFVRVADTAARWEGFTERVPASSKVGDVLRAYNVVDEPFRVVAQPLPYPGFPDARSAPVFPAMTIEVRPPRTWRPGASSEPRAAPADRRAGNGEDRGGEPAPPPAEGPSSSL